MRVNQLFLQMSDRLEYDIIITRAVPKNNMLKNYEYIINYVSDSSKDDWFKYYDIALMLGKLYGGKYYLKHMKHPDGSYVTIDDWCDYVVRY